jgi:hypothetical protein
MIIIRFCSSNILLIGSFNRQVELDFLIQATKAQSVNQNQALFSQSMNIEGITPESPAN